MSLHHILQLAAPESLASYVTTCLRWAHPQPGQREDDRQGSTKANNTGSTGAELGGGAVRTIVHPPGNTTCPAPSCGGKGRLGRPPAIIITARRRRSSTARQRKKLLGQHALPVKDRHSSSAGSKPRESRDPPRRAVRGGGVIIVVRPNKLPGKRRSSLREGALVVAEGGRESALCMERQ